MRTWLHTLDQSVILRVSKLPPQIRPIMEFFTQYGAPLAMGVIAAIVSLVAAAHHETNLAAAALCALGALPLSYLIKLIVRRLRPETAAALGLHTYSFPSGHAYGSLMVLGLLSDLAVTRLAIVGWLITLLLSLAAFSISLSRIYLGAHYPTDVLAGWVLGVIVLVIILQAAQL